jgi:signal transduction histidine kinase
VLLFTAWEVAERTWFERLDWNQLHVAHLVRGIFSSTLIALFVGWFIIRSSPGFLTGPHASNELAEHPLAAEGERLSTYARWFIAMRWLAALLAAILVFLSVDLLEWLPPELQGPLTLTVGLLVGCNVIYLGLLRWRRAVSYVLLLQGYVDVVILTVLLHFSGGSENPLSVMMIFHVIIGGILLSSRQCYGLAAAAAGLLGVMAWAEWAGVLEHYTLQLFPHLPPPTGRLYCPASNAVYTATWTVLHAGVLFLTAYVVTTLSKRLHANERQVVALAERALADRQLLERALETTGAGLRVLGPELQPYWSSKHWDQWFSCQPEEICPGCAVLQQDDSPAQQSLRDGLVRTSEVVLDATNCPPRLIPERDGQRTFYVTTAPLRDSDGKVVQVVELAQEITEQKKAQLRMMHAGKLAAVGELAGQVAHEVNNPISIISAKASLLLSDHAEEMSRKVSEDVAKIAELAKRVARIAQGLLSYCRPSAAARVRLDVRAPIRKSLAVVDEQARRAGIRVEDQLSFPLPPVKANPHELEQVFLNLFLNAIDAMPKGGWLNISTPPSGAQLRDGQPAVSIVVSDTGCGIPDEIREKIFEPFFTTKKEGRGTGLGLSICLGVVRSHGGELEVESRKWQGTRFTVKLPVDAPVVKQEVRHG